MLGPRTVSKETYLENRKLALGHSPCLSVLLDCNWNNYVISRKSGNAGCCRRLTMLITQLVYKREAGIYRPFLSRHEEIGLRIWRLHPFALALSENYRTSRHKSKYAYEDIYLPRQCSTFSDFQAGSPSGIVGIWHGWHWRKIMGNTYIKEWCFARYEQPGSLYSVSRILR